jgi:signal transduction histidine kinase
MSTPQATKSPALTEGPGQDLRRLDRLASLGLLSASMAHEIKNALVAGKTFLDLLLEKETDREVAESVRREFRRIDSLASQMLEYARPARPNLAPLHLHALLDHTLRLIEHRLKAHAIVLTREFRAESDVVQGDDYELEQALVNLFLNALEAMPHHGALSVTTATMSSEVLNGQASGHSASRWLHLTVQDDGPGIAPENLARLFEPFFTTKPHGTGLGLSITRRIIEEHQGSIRAESPPNQGAVFHILLPLA